MDKLHAKSFFIFLSFITLIGLVIAFPTTKMIGVGLLGGAFLIIYQAIVILREKF